MIRTFEEIERQKENDFRLMINKLGGKVVLEKPIRFRLTPHSLTVKIHRLSIEDHFNDYGEAKDTVLQVLRRLTNNI